VFFNKVQKNVKRITENAKKIFFTSNLIDAVSGRRQYRPNCIFVLLCEDK